MSKFDNCLITMGLCLASLGALFTGCSSVSPDGKQWVETPQDELGEAKQALTGTNKMCSAVVPNQFRDTIIVPQGWTVGTCSQWAGSIGATNFNLGCQTDTGFVWLHQRVHAFREHLWLVKALEGRVITAPLC
jgi:hypothetical protein